MPGRDAAVRPLLSGLPRRGRRRWPPEAGVAWVRAKGISLSYHNKETTLFTTDPHYGNLNYTP